jgi:1,6-anhydro-N-acetylmuramate kinase
MTVHDPGALAAPLGASTRLVVGCMSGTSLDGIDAAVVEIDGVGMSMRARVLAGASGPLGPSRDTLARLARGEAATAAEIALAARNLALAHVPVVRAALDAAFVSVPEHARRAPDLVCVHGQTVFHAPPLSWQVMNPAPLAAALGVGVMSDLRAMDLALGGQGAPLTPLADWVLYRARASTAPVTCVVNLGGFANMTWWPSAAGSHADDVGASLARVQGRDVCACNQVLDALARARLHVPFDADGSAASQGFVDDTASRTLLSALRAQGAMRRSLGSGDECAAIAIDATATLSPSDACATACDALARTIAEAIADAAREATPATAQGCVATVILAGGAVRNRALLAALHHHCGTIARATVLVSNDLGVPIELREAACFAILGALAADGVATSLPRVTRVTEPAPIAGSWTRAPRGPVATIVP